MPSALRNTQPEIFFPNSYSGKDKQRVGWESPALLTHKQVSSMKEIISRNLLPNRFFSPIDFITYAITLEVILMFHFKKLLFLLM